MRGFAWRCVLRGHTWTVKFRHGRHGYQCIECLRYRHYFG